MIETDFIRNALSDDSEIWSELSLDKLASFDVPHVLLGRRRSILKGDINEQWARWFAESLADPRRVARQKITYPFLFQEALKAVESRFHKEKTITEKKEIASEIARIVKRLSENMTDRRGRRALVFDERKLLLDISGVPPRCWICGAPFKEKAIQNFLYKKKDKIQTPPFVDILKPRGLTERDYAIEVDHVVPFSKGGAHEGNLELACGWCNRHKGAHVAIYDVEGQPRIAGSNTFGITSLPQPFWVVRLLAVGGKCEHPDGCGCTAKNAELTIAPIWNTGALNPVNLRITCYEHDPLSNKRYQSLRLVKKIWN
jgi:hypothetical protein